MSTLTQYAEVMTSCRSLFEKKTKDYGTSWRILRTSSLTDQIFIKAKRIRSIQELGSQKVDEPISDEFIGIINYGIIALIQNVVIPEDFTLDLKLSDALEYYDIMSNDIKVLMTNKNHDYGEAWRDLRISSMVDLILMKLLRIKQIEDNNGETLVSEDVNAGYRDIINYAVFCLILLNEEN